MKVHVDISLYTESSAFGQISGNIDFEIVPQIGDYVSFDFPRDIGSDDEIYVGLTRVTDRIISARGNEVVSISISDLTLKNEEEAKVVMHFFEKHYGLVGNIYSEE